MTNSSTEYWDIDGTSLSQYGWSVATVGGNRYDLPQLRGDDMKVAYRPGLVHRDKVPDARTVNLIMWLTGTDPATGTNTGDHVLRWNDSWDFLRRLVWKPLGSQVSLTRRWRLTISNTPTLLAATAKAQVSDVMAPTMTGRTRADFTMTLLLADPYYYGAQQSTTLVRDVVTSISNPGHDIASYSNIYIDLVGPLTNPVVGNGTTNPITWVKFNGWIGTGTTVRLNCANFTANRVSDGANYIWAIANSGARRWLTLLPGTNLVNLTADAGTGHAVVYFQPPYV